MVAREVELLATGQDVDLESTLDTIATQVKAAVKKFNDQAAGVEFSDDDEAKTSDTSSGRSSLKRTCKATSTRQDDP